MSELSKRDNETEVDFHKRIIYGKLVDKTLNDYDYSELSTYAYGKEYSSDVARRMFYGSRKTLELIDKEQLNNIEDNELLNKIEDKTRELEKEKIKFQDQKREYRHFLRLDARWEHLKDTLVEEIQYMNKNYPLLNNNVDFIKHDGNIGCLLLSDFHVGLEVDTYFNKFNSDIFKDNIKVLEKKVINYCKLHDVFELNVELLGDLINGYIHISTRIYNDEDVIQQTVLCAEVLSQFLYNISKEISLLNVHYSVGNHGRCMASYRENIDSENFEYLILWHLKTRLSNITNIKFKENKYEDEIIVFKVFDKTIFGVHGHKDKPKSVVNNLTRLLKIIPDEIHMGHYHDFAEKDNVLINGSLSGVDKYAISKRYNAKPMQTLKIYTKDNDEIIYKIGLSQNN